VKDTSKLDATKSILSQRMELLRFTTAGSVDDGKSTLIGRLLHDSKNIFDDQLEAARQATEGMGRVGVDLALITDGLKAEREQGITIDVAYRYFSTPRRSFIIADTPGHVQYTRNMVTGASTANAALILIDARHGVLTQTKRHTFIASLLGIPHIIIAVNKMDLVSYSEKAFEDVCSSFRKWAAKLNLGDIRFLPISAINGDMVVDRGDNMDWYQGQTLLGQLETLEVGSDINLIDLRFPVQLVSRPQTADLHDFRGYMGKVESGIIRVGDEVVVLPSRCSSRVKSIHTFDGDIQEASAPMSICLSLDDDIDISRGDMIVKSGNLPRQEQKFEATLCWMSESSLEINKKYLIKHSTQTVKSLITDLRYRIDVNTLHRNEESTKLELNEIGRVYIKTYSPLFIDDYSNNRGTGGFILIDPDTNDTVAAGMIQKHVEV
jgi:sulfate adenylyltransferase subunit 1